MPTLSQGRIFRRARRAGAVLAAAVAAAALLPGIAGGAPSTPFVAGSGNAYAQVFRAGPTAARLSLAPVIGLSLADYLNTEGRGEATAADWAAIGVSVTELPDNTPTVRVTSNDKNADKGTTELVAGGTDADGNGGGFIELFARATKAPLGESRYRLQRFAIPGFFEISGGQAKTASGIVQTSKGKVRESRAVVTIDEFGFGGQILLSGLRWEAVQRTAPGAKRTVRGSFTVQGASIGGNALPDLTADGIKPAFEQINTAIASTGFAIVPPVFDGSGGVADVSPLSIQIVNSPLGRQFLAPILGAAQPIREPIAGQLIDFFKQLNKQSNDQIEDLSVLVLAADLIVGIASGSSELHIELGGANAYTEGETFSSPFGKFGFKPPDLGPQSVVTPGTAGRPAIPGTVPPTDTGELAVNAPPGTKTVPGDKGGVALAVGFAGLAVAIALAGADWLRMRARRGAA